MSERYLDAQVGVLGSVLIDDQATGQVIHRTREEDFTGQYRTVYKAIKQIFLNGKPVDPVTVSAALGPDYEKLLMQIMDLTPTSANLDTYIDLTLEQSQLARLKSAGEALACCNNLDDARALIGKINRSIGDRPSVRIVTMAQGLQDFYTRQQTKPEFLSWGLGKLDQTVMAERNGDFVVVGGYPSAGKTALSVQMAWTQAKTLRVGYFSLETKPEKLIDRTVTMVTGIDFGKIKRHQLVQEDWDQCGKCAAVMVERNLEIIQAGGLSVADIQALALAGRYDVIYVDYLQLVCAEDTRRSDYEQVSQISKALHIMAQTTGITVVALSQLSRPEKSKEVEKAPGLHSLRQSGQIEQDADVVMLLYKENSKDHLSKRCLKIAKNKEGEAGGILLLDFNGKAQRFTPVENPSTAAKTFSQQGKAIKAANHVKQIDLFQPLPETTDPDDPWKEGTSHDGSSAPDPASGPAAPPGSG